MTELRLYNTRTRSKEVFRPIDPGNVRMYVCGPTVYDRAHIGNARPVVVFDVLYRLLRHVYGAESVTYVRNFTDVDDRIIDRAVATKGADETLEAATRRITDETIRWYHEDMDALGALRPDHEPRCTETIPDMVAMIGTLIAKGHAYVAEDHVLFAVETYERYGSLANRSLDDMIAGSRVEVAPYKKNPMDFVLWKPSTPEQPGWQSPWGRGRPGWHIECSAMAKGLLGEVFDIHAGGIDLQFPHHENEVAQSCSAHDTEVMANWWLHNEMIRVDGQKMAKSLGNFFTVKDLLDKGIPGEVIRFVMLSTHYRQPLDWTRQKVDEAERVLQRWATLAKPHMHSASPRLPDGIAHSLSDDLNTSKAFASIHQFANEAAHGNIDAGEALWSSMYFFELHDFLPHDQISVKVTKGLADRKNPGLIDFVEKLLSDRAEARKSGDFDRADAIRDGLARAGVVVKDTPQGPEWEPTPELDPAKLEALR